MATEIYLVKVGMNMTEGIVEEWYIADGDRVEKGELLYRLETEKVNLDVDAEASGVVKHVVAEGVTMEPGDVVGYIFEEGEEIPADLGALSGGACSRACRVRNQQPPRNLPQPRAPLRHHAPKAAAYSAPRSPASGRRTWGRFYDSDGHRSWRSHCRSGCAGGGRRTTRRGWGGGPSSPMARKLARELGVDLSTVSGTGPGGRITKEDVERAAAAPAAAQPVPAAPSGSVPVKGMRKTIAQRMHESLQSMAQLTMDMDVNMDDAIKLRNQLVDEWADEGIKPTYTDLVIRAVARALEKHP